MKIDNQRAALRLIFDKGELEIAGAGGWCGG